MSLCIHYSAMRRVGHGALGRHARALIAISRGRLPVFMYRLRIVTRTHIALLGHLQVSNVCSLLESGNVHTWHWFV